MVVVLPAPLGPQVIEEKFLDALHVGGHIQAVNQGQLHLQAGKQGVEKVG
jgi:hypothetical protein